MMPSQESKPKVPFNWDKFWENAFQAAAILGLTAGAVVVILWIGGWMLRPQPPEISKLRIERDMKEDQLEHDEVMNRQEGCTKIGAFWSPDSRGCKKP